MPPKGAESCPSKLLQVVDCTDRATHFWLNKSRQEGIRSENTTNVYKKLPPCCFKVESLGKVRGCGARAKFYNFSWKGVGGGLECYCCQIPLD